MKKKCYIAFLMLVLTVPMVLTGCKGMKRRKKMIRAKTREKKKKRKIRRKAGKKKRPAKKKPGKR